MGPLHSRYSIVKPPIDNPVFTGNNPANEITFSGTRRVLSHYHDTMRKSHTLAAKIRVLLVDDHAVVRAGYRILLQTTPDIEVVAEAGTGEEAQACFLSERPDVTIMDLVLPGISGLEIIRRIINRTPDVRILAFSMHEDPIFAEQALQAGALGYVTKSSAATVLVEAVKKVARGEVYVDAAIAQQMAFQKSRGKQTPFEMLSTREFEIMTLLASGTTLEEIARRLSLSYKTIANYSTQIKAKLEVDNIADLTRLAVRHGIIQA